VTMVRNLRRRFRCRDRLAPPCRGIKTKRGGLVAFDRPLHARIPFTSRKPPPHHEYPPSVYERRPSLRIALNRDNIRVNIHLRLHSGRVLNAVGTVP
jgi:hypothetical protein